MPSDIPKFREDCQVCAHEFSIPTALESLFEIPDLIVAVRRNLKQRDCKSHCEGFSKAKSSQRFLSPLASAAT